MRRRDEILIASAAVLAMLFAVLLLACSLPRPECPLGAYPAAVDTDTSGAASGSASASVVSRGGQARGSGRWAGSSDWRCSPICGPGQLLSAREEGKARTVECRAVTRCPDGGPR